VDDIAEQDPEYQWIEDRGAVEITNTPKRPDPKEKSLYGDDGGDSVSTFQMGGASIQMRLEELANQNTPQMGKGTAQAITPASTQQGEMRISSTSSITSTLDGTVESRISSLESVTEQNNQMLQDMMRMMERFTKKEENAKAKRQQPTEVAAKMVQYASNPSRGEEGE
jgi:DNA uptake protein ComE-like DNA-binding protein